MQISILFIDQADTKRHGIFITTTVFQEINSYKSNRHFQPKPNSASYQVETTNLQIRSTRYSSLNHVPRKPAGRRRRGRDDAGVRRWWRRAWEEHGSRRPAVCREAAALGHGWWWWVGLELGLRRSEREMERERCNGN
jgi:hypothetical protein